MVDALEIFFSNSQWRSFVLSLIDYTSLNESDSVESIQFFCQTALDLPEPVAALCIYPQFVKQVKMALRGSGIKVATVANFPAGNQDVSHVTASIRGSIDAGADEIDVVFPYQMYMQSNHDTPFELIEQCVDACHNGIQLKVILETGVLQDPALIQKISQRLIFSGVNFLKTSTGKTKIGATIDAVSTLLTTIQTTKSDVGIKISGGVRSVEQAANYIALAQKTMGFSWVSAQHFRLGASHLVAAIIKSNS